MAGAAIKPPRRGGWHFQIGRLARSDGATWSARPEKIRVYRADAVLPQFFIGSRKESFIAIAKAPIYMAPRGGAPLFYSVPLAGNSARCFAA